MPDYRSYKAEDLLLEEEFIQYCLASESATIFWNDLLIEYPEMQVEVDKALLLYAAISIRVTEKEKQLALGDFKMAIAREINEPAVEQAGPYDKQVKPFLRKRWIAIAAAAVTLGIIVVSALWVTQKISSGQGDTSVTAFKNTNYKQVIQSLMDERKDITLPDGSLVTLNYGSTLKISGDYNEKQRWVYLQGEAFFSVKPDKEKPFVVITDKNATSALGTSFKVRNYPGENYSDVMLATGKVKVQSMSGKDKGSNNILIPGEKLSFENVNTALKSVFDLAVLQNWRSLTINLNKASLDEIITTLEFNYGIRVKQENNPVKAVAFTGKFNKASLQEVLEAISFTNKFSYTQKGNIVSIEFR
ncbi:MAG: FecR domain-containing protein [Gloeobacteraceae cyanobacterium ES-bin-316]|nr:FecR domain-containing protein [Ferruginibacter sp.]